MSLAPDSLRWKKILITRRQSLQHRRKQGAADTLPSWLLSPGTPTQRQLSNGVPMTNTTAKPFLMVALHKLEERMPEFCRMLSDPSDAQAAQACALLDHSVATSPSNSPKHSPTSTPIMNWLRHDFSKKSSSSPVSPTSPAATAIEGEWDNYVAPLILFAGIEVIYGGMLQCEQTPNSMEGLYQRISADLLAVRQTLCDPLLSFHNTQAVSLTKSLDGLMKICATRMQLAGIHSTLFKGGEQWTEVLLSLQVIAQTIGALDVGAAQPILDNILREVRMLMDLIQAALYLSRAMFLESIISIRKCYARQPTTGTRLGRWMVQSIHEILSMLSIYFDRTRAMSAPLYSINSSKLFQGKAIPHDYESDTLELLKRQERLGGPPTAVAVVLDAVAASNFHPERGYDINENSYNVDNLSVLERWPPIFVRSTKHLHIASQKRQGEHMSSSSKSMPWQTDSSPLAPSKRGNNASDWHLAEYPNENVGNGWPFDDDWDALARNLSGGTFLEVSRRESGDRESSIILAESPRLTAVTYRDPLDSSAVISDDAILSQESLSLFSLVMPEQSDGVDDAKDRQGVSHVVPLSDFLYLAVLVKGDEDSRWHRRRGRLSDDEILSFLNNMALKLRPGDLFTERKLPSFEGLADTLLDLPDECDWDDEEQVRDFLVQIKGTFDLRPVLDSRRKLKGISTPLLRSPGRASRRRRRAAGDIDPAASWFLGPELAVYL